MYKTIDETGTKKVCNFMYLLIINFAIFSFTVESSRTYTNETSYRSKASVVIVHQSVVNKYVLPELLKVDTFYPDRLHVCIQRYNYHRAAWCRACLSCLNLFIFFLFCVCVGFCSKTCLVVFMV